MTKIICNKILPGEFVLLSNLSLLPYNLIIEEKDAEGENMMGKRQSVPEQVAERLMQYAQDGWQSLFQNGAAMQEAVLADIIEFGRNSAYAQDHGFAGIGTKEEFLQKVPISEYGDYVSYVQDNMQKDAQQLTDLETEYYLLSTGKAMQGKYYIETKAGALARQLSIDIWNMSLAGKEPIMTDLAVKMLAVTNCAPLDEAPNGKAVRRTSGQAAKMLWERAAQLYVFPYEFLEATMSDDDRDYLTALYTLKEKHFNMLFCNNLAYFGVLLDWIAARPQQMIDDIRNGYMTAELTAEDRAILAETFTADETRADELQQLLDEYGELPVEKIWPEFVFAGVWLAGSVGQFSKDVMHRLPERVRYISESYGSSEAMFNIPMEFGCGYGPLAIYSCYFEFQPLDGGEPIGMAEVKDGEYYELLITTYSGLYRYKINDIVRIRGFVGTTANIEFCCRNSENYLLADRTVHSYELVDVITQAEDTCQCLLRLYQGYVEDGKLSVLLEFDDTDTDYHAFCTQLRQIMEQKQIAAGRFYVMKDGYRNKEYRALMTNGRTMQCIKLPMIVEKQPDGAMVKEIYGPIER